MKILNFYHVAYNWQKCLEQHFQHGLTLKKYCYIYNLKFKVLSTYRDALAMALCLNQLEISIPK